MSILALIFLSMALAVDVFGIAFAYGLVIKKNRWQSAVRLALTCGFFQGCMPIIGYWGTATVQSIIDQFDHILVCGVFVLLGLNIIREALWGEEEKIRNKKLDFKTLLAIGVATSIDALVSGASVYLTKTSLCMSVSIIGVGSFLSGIIGFNLNCCFKKLPEKHMQIFAGLVLIGLGIKSLF